MLENQRVCCNNAEGKTDGKRRRESLGGNVDAAVFPWLTGRCVAKTHLDLSTENDNTMTLCSASFSFHLLMSHMSPGELPASRLSLHEDLTELLHKHPQSLSIRQKSALVRVCRNERRMGGMEKGEGEHL